MASLKAFCLGACAERYGFGSTVIRSRSELQLPSIADMLRKAGYEVVLRDGLSHQDGSLGEQIHHHFRTADLIVINLPPLAPIHEHDRLSGELSNLEQFLRLGIRMPPAMVAVRDRYARVLPLPYGMHLIDVAGYLVHDGRGNHIAPDGSVWLQSEDCGNVIGPAYVDGKPHPDGVLFVETRGMSVGIEMLRAYLARIALPRALNGVR